MAPKKEIKDPGGKAKGTADGLGKKVGKLGERIKKAFRADEEKTVSKDPAAEKPVGEKLLYEKPAGKKAAVKKPAAEKPASKKPVKVQKAAPARPAKPAPAKKTPAHKLPDHTPTEETVVFSDDMTKQFSSGPVKKNNNPAKKNPAPKKEMTQEIPVVGKRSLFKPRDKKPNFAVGVILTTIKMGFVAIVVAVAIGLGSLLGVANAYLGTTPELDVSKIENQSENSQILYPDGSLLATYTGSENREWADLEEIPIDFQNAVIDLEDIRFKSHNGVDFRRLMGAFISNVSGGKTEGGSTITQQLVKNELLTNERSYKRKLQEAYLATELEKTYSKDDILEAYLNAIPLGGTVYGVKAAAKDYFNKDLSQLTLKEMICLASVTQNPARYNPRTVTYSRTDYLPGLINRMNIDAERMYWNGDITKEQYDEVITPAEEYLDPSCLAQDSEGNWKLADGAEMKLKEGYLDVWKAEMNVLEKSPVRDIYPYPHFVEYLIYDVQTFFLEKEGLEDTKTNRNKVDRELRTGGYKIYSTINTSIQDTVQDTLANWDNYPERDPDVKMDADGNPYEVIQPQAASVVIENSTGKLMAIIGSRTTPDKMRTTNRTYQSMLMVGSSAKPLSVYGPAFELGYGEGSYVPNIDADINGWLDDKGQPSHPRLTGPNQPITIHDAIVDSRNVAAAQTIMNYVGINKSVEYLYKLGISEDSLVSPVTGVDMRTGSGLALGVANITPIEMAGAYATIARGGEYKQPISFTQVLDSKGNIVIDAEQDREQHEAFSDSTCYMLTDCLVDAVKEGTGRNARLSNMTTAGKTGTNDTNRGMFFAGYTPYYTSTLWVGDDRYDRPLPKKLAASSLTAPIWKSYMEKIHEGLADKPIVEGSPEDHGLARVTVCKYSNKKPSTSACVPVTALMPANSPLLNEDCDVCVSVSSSSIKMCGISHMRFVEGSCPEESAVMIPLYKRSFAEGSPYANWNGGSDGNAYSLSTDPDGTVTGYDTTQYCNLNHAPTLPTPTPSNPIPSPIPTDPAPTLPVPDEP